MKMVKFKTFVLNNYDNEHLNNIWIPWIAEQNAFLQEIENYYANSMFTKILVWVGGY